MQPSKNIDVVVVGRGVAGLAAAWFLGSRGVRVRLVADTGGGSSLFSGAVDATKRSQRNALDWDELRKFFDESQWNLPADEILVASLSGELRHAVGAHRSILDLARLDSGSTIAVPAFPHQNWNAHLLASSWNAHPLNDRDLRFEVVGLGPWLEDWSYLPGADINLGAWFDSPSRVEEFAGRIVAAAGPFDALVAGPWLGLKTPAWEHLQRLLGRPVGETLSEPGGVAGERWEQFARRKLEQTEVDNSRARVVRIREYAQRVEVELDSGEKLETKALLLATGGLTGGGFVWRREQTELAAVALRGPVACSVDVDACVVVDGQPCFSPGSAFGMRTEHWQWPIDASGHWPLDRIWLMNSEGLLLDSSRKPYGKIYVAGAAAVGEAAGMLNSATDAFRVAARIIESIG